MANENKPLNEAKPNEPITAQRWNDMQVALRKEHLEHSHNGKWKDGLFSGAPLGADGLADNAVTTRSIADGHVTPPKLDPDGNFKVRALTLHGGAGDKQIPLKAPVLAVTGSTFLTGPLRVSPAGKDNLYVAESFVEIGGGANPLRFTSLWSSFTDQAINAAEISNDTTNYKALMIVGNRSGGGVRRIAMWDRVDVIGRLVVGPGGDAGLTVNGPIDGTVIKGNDLQTVTLGVAGLATVGQLKVNGAVNSGPVNVTGALTVSDVVTASIGVRIGPTALQAFNRVQIQNGGLHMDGNPIYLRADVRDQYDLLRWNPNGDIVELGGFQGVNLGFTKNAANVVAPALAVRDGFVDVGLNGNPLRFSTNWQNTPAAGTNYAEISNDTGNYRTLMIIGNRSNDGNTRRVSVWDRLEVNGELAVSGGLRVADRLHVQSGRVTAGSAAYAGGEARLFNAEGELKSFGGGAGYRMSDRNDPNNVARDWVLFPAGQALTFWNGTTGDAAVLTNAGRLRVNKIQLGGKWLLSGDGDVESNDHWLRLKSATGASIAPYTTGYYGGFAAWFLWSWNGVNSGSDRALKRDIAPLESALDRVCRLRGVSFRWKNEGDPRLHLGLVAQEVQEVYPEVVAPGPDGFLGVQYDALVAPLVEAVKEQQQQIRGLRRELAELRERLV